MTIHHFYNCRIADPSQIHQIFDEGTVASMRREDFNILDFQRTDGELQDASSTLIEIEIENPGLGGIIGSTDKFLLVWEEYTRPNLTIGRRICGTGRIVGLPSSLMGATMKVKLDCKTSDWEAMALTLWQNHLPSDVPAPDILPYKDKILSVQDFVDGTWYVHRVDHRTLEMDIVPVANMSNVDASKPPGHLVGDDGRMIWDFTDLTIEDLDLEHVGAPVEMVAGDVGIAWNQRANGELDLSGVVQSAFQGRNDGLNGYAGSLTPEAFSSSFPKQGQVLTTGVTVRVANYDMISGVIQRARNQAGADVTDLVSQGYVISDASMSTVTARWSGYRLKPGVRTGLVCDYRYTQPRDEALNVVVRMAVQDYALTSTAEIEFKPQPLSDPTVYNNIKPFRILVNYKRADIVLYQNKLWFCLTAHFAGSVFDATKWMLVNVPIGAGAAAPAYSTTVGYNKGAMITRDGQVYICLGQTFGAFDPTKWQLAAGINGIVVFWAAGIAYSVGQLVSYNSVVYACATAHTSGSTFDATKFDTAPTGASSVPLAAGAPEFFSTARGATSILWHQCREYAVGFRRALALKGTFTLVRGEIIDAATDFTTADLRKGDRFRLRKSKLSGPYAEILAIVTSVTERVGGDGEASVKIGFKVSVGAGTGSKVFAIPASFFFTPAVVEVDTRLLGYPGSVVSLVQVTGDSMTSQMNIVGSLAASATSTDIEATIQNALGAGANKLNLVCSPLQSLELPTLDHGAMITAPMFVPRGIVLL